MAGFSTLYHINRHPNLFPQPLRPNYEGNNRQLPEKAIWLSKDYRKIIKYHGILGKGNVHAFSVDNGLIDACKRFYDRISEVVFDEQTWENGIRDGKIKYLGKVPQNKIPEDIFKKHDLDKKQSSRYRQDDNIKLLKVFYRLEKAGLLRGNEKKDLYAEISLLLRISDPKTYQDKLNQLNSVLIDIADRTPRDLKPEPNKEYTATKEKHKAYLVQENIFKEMTKLKSKVQQSLLPKNRKLELLREVTNFYESADSTRNLKTLNELNSKIVSLRNKVDKVIREEELGVGEFIKGLNKVARFVTIFYNSAGL